MSSPLISVVIPTKNSLPHLKNAIEGIRSQTYRNFELIIQDGGSTDGTLEYLNSIRDLPKIDIQSLPDSGIGQAYNRGISRSSGEYLFLAASDERLFDQTFEKLLFWFAKHPNAAVIYGGVRLVDGQGRVLSQFFPKPFDLLKVMKCEIVPPTSGLLNRKIIGSDLFYDESLKTCPDYDFWLRLGVRFSSEEIISMEELAMTNLADRTSMSYRAESFLQFCKDKCYILDRFLGRPRPVLNNIFDLETECLKAKAGILTWAAKEVMNIEGLTPNAIRLFRDAAALSEKIDSPRAINQTFSNVFITQTFNRVIKRVPVLKLFQKWFDKLFKLRSSSRWEGGESAWGYIMQAYPSKSMALDSRCNYWIKIRMRVFSGVVGVCFMDDVVIDKEKYFPLDANDILVYYPIHDFKKFSVIFRNGGIKQSIFEIYELSVVQTDYSTV